MLARSQVLLSARAAGIQHPMEAVFMDFRNLDALRVECELARRLGYVGKVAIHPAQVAVINDVFTPAPDVVAYQRKVLAAFEEAEANGSASIAVDGKMVDYAVARVAKVVIARAEAAESSERPVRRRGQGEVVTRSRFIDGGVGVAVIGCGSIGSLRAQIAHRHPSVDYLVVCDVVEERAADSPMPARPTPGPPMPPNSSPAIESTP